MMLLVLFWINVDCIHTNMYIALTIDVSSDVCKKFGLSPCNAVNMLYSEGAVNGLREQCHVMLLQEEREAGQCPKKSDIIWWPAVGSLNCGD